MTAWTEGQIDSGGVSMHYHRTGGNGPALVLLHGITDNGLCWSRVARDLEGQYDLIMPDARGHGRSGRPQGDFSVEVLGDDVAALIRALALDRPCLFGHSMGAITAVDVVARYPDLVRGMILEDPPFTDDSPAPEGEQSTTPARSWQWVEILKQQPREERIAWARAANPTWSEDELVPWAASKDEVSIHALDHHGAARRYPWRDALTHITCPILLLTADPERGAIVTPAIAREASELWRTGRVAHIAGAGHSIHRDRYEEVMAEVRDFLEAQA